MNSFVFYKSFYDAMQLLDEQEKCDFITLICELAFNGIEADFTKTSYSDIVKALYTVSAEQIKASIMHKMNGTKGGRPRNEISESEVKRGVLTPVNTNVNVNANVKDNVKVNDNVNSHTSSFLPNNNNLNIINWAKSNTIYQDTKRNQAKAKQIENLIINNGIDLGFLDFVLDKTLIKYKPEDINFGLIVNAANWYVDDYKKLLSSKSEKKNTKTIDYSNAPKKCDNCGAEVTPYGVPYSVMCVKCRKTWELKNGLWLCDAAS